VHDQHISTIRRVTRTCIKKAFKKSVSFPPTCTNTLVLIELQQLATRKNKINNRILPLEQPTTSSTRINSTYNNDYIIAKQFQNDIYEQVDDD